MNLQGKARIAQFPASNHSISKTFRLTLRALKYFNIKWNFFFNLKSQMSYLYLPASFQYHYYGCIIRPLYIFYCFSAGIDLYSLDSVKRRQVLTSKVGLHPRNERVS